MSLIMVRWTLTTRIQGRYRYLVDLCHPHISEHIPFQAKSQARAETAKIRRTRSSQPEKANFRALSTGTVVLVDSSHLGNYTIECFPGDAR